MKVKLSFALSFSIPTKDMHKFQVLHVLTDAYYLLLLLLLFNNHSDRCKVILCGDVDVHLHF